MKQEPADNPLRRRLLRAALAAPLAPSLALLPGCATGRSEAEREMLALAAAMAVRPVVLLGEVHDNVEQHRLRALALQHLLAGGARPAIAFEQFDREQQPLIDRLRTESARQGMPAGVQARQIAAMAGRSGWNWPLYEPYLALAIEHQLPIIAANLSRADAMKIGRASGFDALFDAVTIERFGLDRLPDDYLAAHRQAVDDGHCKLMRAELLPALARAQIARDVVLLQSIRPAMTDGVVLLTGNGHVRKDIGLPFLMSADERKRTQAIGLLERDEDGSAPPARWRERFDAVFVTSRQSRPDPCEGLRKRSERP